MSGQQEYECSKGHRWETLEIYSKLGATDSDCPICNPTPPKPKGGGPAFPGMSLRDWFAGQALSAMTIAPDYSKGPCNAALVERAFVIADLMLAAQNKP